MMNTQSDEQKSVSDATRGVIVTQTQGTPTPTTASTEAPLSTSSTVNSTSTTANYKVTIESPNNSPTADEDGTINTAYAHPQVPNTQGSPSKWDEIEELEQLFSAKTTSSVKEPASRQESNTYDSAGDNEQVFKRRDYLGGDDDDDDDEVGKTLKSSSFNAQLDQYNSKHNQIYTSRNTSNAMGVADGVTGKRQSKKPDRFSPNSTEKQNSSTKEKRASREPSDPEDNNPSSSYDESSEDSESESSVDKQEEFQADTPSPKKKRRAAAGKNRKKDSKNKSLGKVSSKNKSAGKGKKIKGEYIDSSSDTFIGGVYSYIQNNKNMAECYSYTISNIGKKDTKDMLDSLLGSHEEIFCSMANVCTTAQFHHFSKDIKSAAESIKAKKLGIDKREAKWKEYVQSKAIENTDAHDALPYNNVVTQFKAAQGLRFHKALLLKTKKSNSEESQWKCVKDENDFGRLFSGKSPFVPQVTAKDSIDPTLNSGDKREIAGFPSRYSAGEHLCKKYNNHNHVTSYDIPKREGIEFLYLFGIKEVWQKKMVDPAHPVPKKKKIVKDDGLNCEIGDILYIDGRDTRLWGKCVYFVGAYKFVNGMKQDKVGYVKSLHLDLEMITNRFVQVVDGDGDVFGIEQGDILRVKFIKL